MFYNTNYIRYMGNVCVMVACPTLTTRRFSYPLSQVRGIIIKINNISGRGQGTRTSAIEISRLRDNCILNCGGRYALNYTCAAMATESPLSWRSDAIPRTCDREYENRKCRASDHNTDFSHISYLEL